MKIGIILAITVAFLYICHTHSFIKFMTSILGKLTVVCVILYYSSIDKIYGILVTLLIIVFYQMDTTRWIEEGFFDIGSLTSAKSVSNGGENQTYVSVIDLEDNITERRKSEFQKRHCSVEGDLTYKNLPVKKDMADILFPEIRFEGGVCNVCDKNCEFNV